MRYRVPLFREWAGRPGVDLRVLHGALGGVNVPAEGFEAREAPVRVVRFGGHPWYWQPAQRAAVDGADVIVLNWDAHYLSLAPALRRARKLGVGSVLWGHGFGRSDGKLLGKPKRWLAGLADALVLYSDADAEAYREQGFARCFGANNAIDVAAVDAARRELRPVTMAAFREANGLTGKRVLLHVSRLSAERRLDVAVRGLQQLSDDVVLTVLGDGPARQDVAALAAELGVADRLRMPGAVWGEAALAPWFAAADLYVHPEHLGLSGLHALAHGVPVLTGDQRHGHGPEWTSIEGGVNGLKFASLDPLDLAVAAARLLKDDELRQQYGAAGAAMVREKHTIPRMADALLDACRAARAVHAAARAAG